MLGIQAKISNCINVKLINLNLNSCNDQNFLQEKWFFSIIYKIMQIWKSINAYFEYSRMWRKNERTCSRDDYISTESFLVISRQGFLAAAATQ